MLKPLIVVHIRFSCPNTGRRMTRTCFGLARSRVHITQLTAQGYEKIRIKVRSQYFKGYDQPFAVGTRFAKPAKVFTQFRAMELATCEGAD